LGILYSCQFPSDATEACNFVFKTVDDASALRLLQQHPRICELLAEPISGQLVEHAGVQSQ
jgi:hypothetical protein